MRIVASDFYTLHSPSRCELRVYLAHQGIQGSPPGPFEQVLFRLGDRHEASHLATLGDHVDLRGGTREARQERSREAIARGAGILYQPVLCCEVEIGQQKCEVIGEPDFLMRENDGYVVRDSKLARRVDDRHHPEIIRQLNLYGALYERSFGRPPRGLQVHSGSGDIVDVPYAGRESALADLEEIVSLKLLEEEPYSPVGWSKCNGCAFRQRCWERAEASRDVALVPDVDQGLVLTLRDQGVQTYDDLAASYDEGKLAAVKRPWGSRTQRVGAKAPSILASARCLSSGREEILRPPAVPDSSNFAMFDLEGVPPHLDELGRIYLWGLKVFGERPSGFRAAVAGFGPDGDREGWLEFLRIAKEIFDDHGDIPFVHWSPYERTHVKAYVAKYGDRDGIAARVEANLLDLLPVTKEAIALPLPSYSLKVIEDYIGFRRSQDEYGGAWSMATFIEATETEDDSRRRDLMEEILRYNEEDLDATWAVLEWLRAKT